MEKDKKWEALLQLIAHPENYSEQQKEEILADEDSVQLYQQLVEMQQAMTFGKTDEQLSVPDINEEWEKFAAEKTAARRHSWRQWIAACVVVLFFSSITYAVWHHQRIHDKGGKNSVSASVDVALASSGERADTVMEQKRDSIEIRKVYHYDNVPLKDIMKDIADRYHVNVKYRNERVKMIRLYLQWAGNQRLDEVIELMNHFESVHLMSRLGCRRHATFRW